MLLVLSVNRVAQLFCDCDGTDPAVRDVLDKCGLPGLHSSDAILVSSEATMLLRALAKSDVCLPWNALVADVVQSGLALLPAVRAFQFDRKRFEDPFSSSDGVLGSGRVHILRCRPSWSIGCHLCS